jgi:hypothetical protein
LRFLHQPFLWTKSNCCLRSNNDNIENWSYKPIHKPKWHPSNRRARLFRHAVLGNGPTAKKTVCDVNYPAFEMLYYSRYYTSRRSTRQREDSWKGINQTIESGHTLVLLTAVLMSRYLPRTCDFPIVDSQQTELAQSPDEKLPPLKAAFIPNPPVLLALGEDTCTSEATRS